MWCMRFASRRLRVRLKNESQQLFIFLSQSVVKRVWQEKIVDRICHGGPSAGFARNPG